MNKKTTIVIPNYNGIKYIEDCLKSVFSQTISSFDVIVVDNASKDNSLLWIKEHYPQIQIIENNENLGFSEAVNQGIKASKTPYIILLNNDTVIEKDFVHQLEKAVEESEDIFSASAKMISLHQKEIMDDAGDYYCALGWAYAYGKGKSSELYNKKRNIFASCGGAAIYRREIFDKIGYFDELHFAYLEDIDIGYRAKIFGYRNVYAPNAIVYHAGSAVSGSRYNEFKVNLSSKNSIYLIYKNMPLFQIFLNLPILLLGFLIKTLFFVKKGLGRIYIRGLCNGIKLCLSKEGRNHKIYFKSSRTLCYLRIEVELLFNTIRRFCK